MTAVILTGGGAVTPPVVTPDSTYTLTKFPLARNINMQEAQLAEFPFVLKLSGSNGIVYYISAEGKKETFMASNDDINKPDKTQLPFTAAGRNGKKVSLKDDTLIQMTQNSLNNLSNDTKIAEKVEILLNNSLATSGIDNIGLFNNIAMGFGALTKNAETGKITFDHNEQFLFGDIDTAVKNVTPLENKEGAYSFTFEKAEITVTEDKEFYPEARNGLGGTVDIIGKKIGNVYINFPTITNDRGVSSDAVITMNDMTSETIAFSTVASENVKATAGLTVTVTENAGVYTVTAVNNTAEILKDAKVYVVIGKSGLVAKTVSLGDVPAKQ